MRAEDKKRDWFVGIAVGTIILLACAGYVSITTWVPNDALTMTRVHCAFARMGLYVEHHRAFPKKLADMPEIHGKGNELHDAWGHPLIQHIDPDGVVTIMSLGRDRRLGGLGEGRDFGRSCRFKNDYGQWLCDAGGDSYAQILPRHGAYDPVRQDR